MTGLCACGCGQRTRVADRTSRRDGTVLGQPLRYVRGHNARTHPTAEQRFWAKVDKSGDCWLWLASANRKGYGHIWLNGRYEQAHRYAYEIAVGPIPLGLQIDHLCRTPQCVNPQHLEPVTLEENSRRRRAAENLITTSSRSTS